MLRVSTLALLAAALAAPALAQGRSSADYGNRSVTVDMSVLDALGPEYNVPDMNSGSTRRSFNPSTPLGRRTMPTDGDYDAQSPAVTGGRGVTLHPPRGSAPRATAPHRSAPRASTSKPTSSQTKSNPPPQQARTTSTPSAAATPPPARPPEAAPPPPAVAPAAGPAISPPVMAPPQPSPAQDAAATSAPAPPAPAAAPATPARPMPELVSPLGPVPPSSPTPPPPVASAPPPAPTPPPPAAARTATPQTASLAPAPAPAPSGGAGQLSLKFSGEDASLGEVAKRDLDAVATRAGRDESLRLQLVAYASGAGESANSARRLSLSRALAVRSYLIDKGVRSTRIDVRALGNRLEGGGDPDRVDVIVGGK